MKKQGVVICGFPGIGKSYLAKRHKNVVDLDLGDFQFLNYDHSKSRADLRPNPNFPQNYCEAVLNSKEKYDFVLACYSGELWQFLQSKGIEFFLAIPKKTGWRYLEERFKARGNDDEFIKIVKQSFLQESAKTDANILWLEDGEFLENALARKGLLTNSKN